MRLTAGQVLRAVYNGRRTLAMAQVYGNDPVVKIWGVDWVLRSRRRTCQLLWWQGVALSVFRGRGLATLLSTIRYPEL